jgi:hypothetical protein
MFLFGVKAESPDARKALVQAFVEASSPSVRPASEEC